MNTKYNDLNVLVVDDYEKLRAELCKILTSLNLNIFEASNGIEAMEVLHREKVDAVFTDIVMPEMDGFELCEEIRKSSEMLDMPIIAVSTHCDSNHIVKALRLGADDYIPKPADKKIVKKVLTRVLTSIE